MFSHRSFLVLGGGAADILSLLKGGLEVLECRFAFQQGVDQRGKATTRVYSGAMDLTLSQLPPKEITQWALNSRKYVSGMIVSLNDENIPVEKIFFENGACIHFELDYVHASDSYATTKLLINAEKIIVGDGVDFNSEWSLD